MNIPSKSIKFQRHIRDFWHSYGRTLLLIGVPVVILIATVRGYTTWLKKMEMMRKAPEQARTLYGNPLTKEEAKIKKALKQAMTLYGEPLTEESYSRFRSILAARREAEVPGKLILRPGKLILRPEKDILRCMISIKEGKGVLDLPKDIALKDAAALCMCSPSREYQGNPEQDGLNQ